MLLSPVARSLVFLVLVAIGLIAFAQVRPPDNRPRNCSISGRVTIGGPPAANSQVIASEITQSRNGQSAAVWGGNGSPLKTVHKTRADADGMYQFTGLPAGHYQVRVWARAFISAENDLDHELGRTITLDDGEAREKLDFALVRGGVITGRVIDAEGRAPIAHPVHLFRVERQGLINVDGNQGSGYLHTDDRGIYRAYGLRPGNYVVSAGDAEYFDRLSGARKYRRTFYPDATDEKQAQIITLGAGDEKTGVDIKLAAGGKRYVATGRVVDAETGKPVANATIGCNKIIESGSEQAENDGASEQTDAAGNFRLAGLSSGRYAFRLFGNWTNGVEYYAENQFFEIAEEDISGVEIKATAGGVLSGVAIIEGLSGSTSKSKLGQIMLIIFLEGETPFQQTTFLNPDGTFRVAGVPPGKVRLMPFSQGDRTIQFLRVERGGVELKDAIPVAKGEMINDLRLVFGQSNGVIRGQVQIVGGQLPKGWRLSAGAQRSNNGSGAAFSPGFSTDVDERGRFVFEGLSGGEYDLYVLATSPTPENGGTIQSRAQQKVTVTNGAEVQVTVRIDPKVKEQ
jgi:protocatechuate 3,4-dioxygenase beta subunit